MGRRTRRVLTTLAVTVGIALAGVWVAAQISLTTFSPGTPISSADVNANFAALGEAINDVAGKFGGPGTAAAGMGGECVIGQVWLSAGATAAGVPAHGQLLPVSGNDALFSLLGTKYGGNGTTTFALPDLSDVEPRSANGEPLTYVICTEGLYPSRP